MDVVCGRCRAEYEFDDALISERGTTVRCTNCGLQFKVFPPVGRRAPEVWRVFESAGVSGASLQYGSLAELQIAIARGEVGANHLLSRGNEDPRPLSEIVELQPLLQQPKSIPPPSTGGRGEKAEGRRAQGGTVIGIMQRPNPTARSMPKLSPEGSPQAEAESKLDQEPIVPADRSTSSGTKLGLPHVPTRQKIRSALSISPRGEGSNPINQVPSDRGRPAIAPPRASLRGALNSSRPVDGEPVSRDELSSDEQGLPAERPSPSTEEFSAREVSASEEQSRQNTEPSFPRSTNNEMEPRQDEEEPSNSPASQASSEEIDNTDARVEPSAPRQPKGASKSDVEDEKTKTHSVEPEQSSGREAVEESPAMSEAGELPGQWTPTPTGIPAFHSADSKPASSGGSEPRGRQARSGGFVLAVLVGGGLFLGVANRDRIMGLVPSDEKGADSAKVQPEAAVLDQLGDELKQAEAHWIRTRLLGGTDTRGVMDRELYAKLNQSLIAAERKESWEMVNVLRAEGSLVEARKLAGELSGGEGRAYSLALLDLAENSSSPPWSVVLARLKEAATGERGEYLARTVYIYCLAEAGELQRANLDLQALRQLRGASQAPLYADLVTFLARKQTSSPEKPSNTVTPVTSQEESSESVPSDETQPTTGASKGQPALASDQAASPTQKVGAQSPKKEVKVSSAVQAKVTQADSLWRSGNRDGAIVLYRQILSEMGSKHFLGQRSSARIQQAKREAVKR